MMFLFFVGMLSRIEGFDHVGSVPTVDLSISEEEASSVLREALRNYGFFYVKSHGISDELVSQQFAASRDVFNLEQAVKETMSFESTLDIGYLSNQGLDEDSGQIDTKEGFLLSTNAVILNPNATINPDDPLAGSVLKWPTALPEYETIMREWTKQMYNLNGRLNKLLFRALGGIENSLALNPFIIVKQLRYAPTLDNLGAGAHADWGSLTILATDQVPGLEIESDSGAWIPVPPRPGCFIVNAGDQVEFYTRGFFRSANHRVRPTVNQVRFSTALFAYFDYDKVVHPLTSILDFPDANFSKPISPGVSTGDYFSFKLCESVGKPPEDCRRTQQQRGEEGQTNNDLPSSSNSEL
mmetsp:Transcript_14682/g.17818  ORF Transcript_14682/g.17818 Transcript_14682/m.17818 type:complete len:354 (+) Transcript_14682:65-1126(+)